MATFVVSTLVDENDNGVTIETIDLGFGVTTEVPVITDVSLREAIQMANDSAGEDTIVFEAGVQGLIRLTQGEITITDDVIIEGGGVITITGDGANDDVTTGAGLTNAIASDDAALNNNSRIFNASADISLNGLTLTGGRTTANDASGGAVSTTGAIEISDSLITGNSTVGDNALGGGIYAAGTLSITNSTVVGNGALGNTSAGGALASRGDLVIESSTITGNVSTDYGGGAASEGEITVSNSIILGNFSDTGGYSSGYYGGFYEIFESTDAGANGLITVAGANIIGENTLSFSIPDYADPASVGTVVNASPMDVFATNSGATGVLSGFLANNGGLQQTVALLSDVNNPALDATNTGGLDARGFPRGIDLASVDNGGTSDIGSFELLDEAPTPATITSGAAFTVGENTLIAADVDATDPVESEGNGLIFSITGGADAGLFTINSSNGVVSFRDQPDFENPQDANGDNIHEISVNVRDALSDGDTQDITITVTDAGDAPVADPGTANGDEDTIITGVLTAADADGDNLTFSLLDAPANGDVVVNPDGSFTFTPDLDFNGEDSFTFTVSDGALTDTDTATITINPVFDPDVPSPDNDDLIGTAADDNVSALGGDDTLSGFDGDDTLIGNNGDDIALGGDGADFLRGGSGDDTLRGNVGDDDIAGGAGQDDVLAGDGDDAIKGNGGADILRGNAGADNIRAGSGADEVLGGNGADTITGNSGADDLRGNNGRDEISGGVGADTIKGGGGGDLIDGGGGADLLEGGTGQDTITGRGGDDTLQGDGGADIFQFRATDVNDTILDFTQGVDTIEIISGAAAFADLVIEQDGDDVLIGFGDGQVRVVTDTVDAFTEDDFIFS